ncbi:hypothetical protein SARC_06719 [Sphaeroforma arctica JP610]|uniref:Uncharacterized protein n=1 Tax=Sphaeroforma arctica JP610 TaxID=667725 RepID=A0A0L0FWI8_9EUKA|nr:hypothetical protein SARC_06719 [Sphaeroforma arctica JP610]KNC80931.1 hypothetical protein SARC_06719 [Sphaeroforma arctica JP610]|eukprot:XP_014154833.1 hypothetical protein SARC_06719 [Sphaeroforma arctica JP610]
MDLAGLDRTNLVIRRTGPVLRTLLYTSSQAIFTGRRKRSISTFLKIWNPYKFVSKEYNNLATDAARIDHFLKFLDSPIQLAVIAKLGSDITVEAVIQYLIANYGISAHLTLRETSLELLEERHDQGKGVLVSAAEGISVQQSFQISELEATPVLVDHRLAALTVLKHLNFDDRTEQDRDRLQKRMRANDGVWNKDLAQLAAGLMELRLAMSSLVSAAYSGVQKETFLTTIDDYGPMKLATDVGKQVTALSRQQHGERRDGRDRDNRSVSVLSCGSYVSARGRSHSRDRD